MRSTFRLALAALIAAAPTWSHAQQPPLTQLQFDIVGVRLVVDPPTLTVPKNIATQINTSLALPPGAGPEANAAIATLTDGAAVEAELRGPDLAPTRIVTRAGQPIPIPPLAIPGDYFLDGIRLVKNGKTVLDATATDGRLVTTIPIRVISEVFVTNVTSRPLSLDEIRGKGIVIDQNNFRAVNFQVAFNIDGAPFTISLPAALPTPEFLQQRPSRETVIEQLTTINQKLKGLETQLPPQFDRPGLNFSIAALPFFPVEDDGGVPSLDIPPITGLVVIPGNVAFLNQFFSVLLMVTNVAPDGTTLELRETTATIVLPTGLDRTRGSYEAPGDDPLRLARIEGIGVQPTVPVLQLGPDGLRNTGDDIAAITPQKTGEAEFLVEGLKEGSHLFDLEIEAMLYGLPSGPVKLVGVSAGAVFVRNPTFSVTLAHPRTIRSGEPYNLYATITNTSQSTANLVSVNLDPRGISGAQLVSDQTVAFETIAAGQAVTAKFSLIAQKTGEVTFSSFTGEAAAGGGIQLTTGVDERGVPLAPNAIVLPKSADALPSALVTAAQRVLGQAFSIATAPAEALPPGVLFVKKQTVIDRGLDLAQAGERIGLGEPLGRVIQDLLLDWLGNTSLDPGFDQILRTTEAGAAFLAEVAAIVQLDASGPGILPYQAAFAQTTVGRAPHVSAAVGSTPGVAAPLVTISRALGGAVGRSPSGAERSLTSAAALDLVNTVGDARIAVAGVFEPDTYTFEFSAIASGVYDIGVVVPGLTPGQLTHVRYPGVQLDAGGRARVVLTLPLSGASLPPLAIDRTGDGQYEGNGPAQPQIVMEAPPGVLAVRQLVSAYREAAGDVTDPATYGLIVGVLFDKPVTAASAELKTNYTLEANNVIGARLQSSGRLVYLYLERPVGALVPRSITISGITDARGHLLSGATTPIVMALSDGARVFGQVRTSDGRGVPASVLKLAVSMPPFGFDVSTITTDGNGAFDFDFVPRIGNVVLTAQHPTTLEVVSLTARIRAQGEQLLLNPTFQGKGLVRGRALAADGVTPAAGAQVALLPGAVSSNRGYSTRANALGEFSFADVPVGVFTLSAADTSGGFGQTTGVLNGGGQTAELDIVLTARNDDGGRIVGRVFLSDGSTPGAGFTVFVGRYRRDSGKLEALDRTTADATGSFAFARTLPVGGYDVVAYDAGSGQLGVASVGVAARLTSSVSIVLEATGSVEGVVFNASGVPQAGALVAGGLALVQTDANGFFRIDGVPAGPRRIEAGDPVTRRRGSAQVVVLPGQTVSAAIRLEARATITGRVLDANGAPVPRATVRIPSIGGYTFVFANNAGVFRFPDMPLGDYLIQAPGPSQESLISFMEANGYDPSSAFTAGDVPPGVGESATPSFGDKNAVLAAYQEAVRTFLNVDESLLVGLPMEDLGGFGWTRARLFQDSTTAVADVRFLAQGTIAGRTVDADGRNIGALTRILGLSVSRAGAPTVAELGRMTTNASTGAFSFARIPRFDLATFQNAGVRGGDFTIDAAHPFSPVIATVRGQLNTTTPNVADLIVQFPSATETNGTIRGRVLMPDGTTPAPAGTQVAISFGDLTVTTDAAGRFESALPIPAGPYTLTAQAPSGLRGRAQAIVPAGGGVDVTVQLLGLGNVTVSVKRPNGQPVIGAAVALERGTFPGDRLNGTTNASGEARFVNVTEGPFSVAVQEAITGLTGRGSGIVVRDADISVPVVITASGRVTGRFLTADGLTAIPFAQVVLSTGGVRGYTTTDAAGRFELSAIPVGRFTVEAVDPNSGRLGRASDDLVLEGQTVDVTILQLPRGVVTGIVLQSDGSTVVPGASVSIESSATIQTSLQASTRPDGSFRFEGIPFGNFTLTAREPLGGFSGTATGRISFENEIVDRTITLAPFGALRVTLLDVGGQPASNATVTISRGENFSRTAAVDVNGQFTFELLPLGTYTVVGRSLASSANGGQTTATLTTGAVTEEVSVNFRGAGSVSVTVVAADGVTPIPSAQVRLNATGAAPGNGSGAMAGSQNGFTSAAGTITFQNVPVGALVASAEAAALGGVSNGELSSPGQTVPLTVRLGPSGSVTGRLLLPDGITPAAQALVTIRFAPQSTLQTGVVQITTTLTGTFEFTGIPVGAFTIEGFEIVSSSVRTLSGAIVSNGQRVDLGDVALDNTSPRVTSVDPIDRAAGVTLLPAIAITFSEPMRPGSFRTSAGGNVVLLDGTTAVPLQSATFSNGNRTVTIRPVQPLRSAALHTLTVRGGQDGPSDDAADLRLVDSFVSTFATADTVPPAVVSSSPAAGQRQVLLDSSIRVAFSEPIASGSLTLRTAAGAVVPGETAFTAGNTTIAFAPQAFLLANTTYTATVTGVVDTGGNALAGGLTFSFSTLDTIAPAITALQIAGTPRPGAQITITPVITGTDVHHVEYLIGATVLSSAASPFAVSTTVPSGATALSLVATAFDEVGNRSSAFTQQISVQANAAPTIVLRTVPPMTQIGQGQSVEFEAVATDDDRVARIALSAVGAASFSEVREAPAASTQFTTRFTVQVPANAVSGSMLIAQAVAVDSAGAQSAAATVSLTVVDGVRPSVTIQSPVSNAVIIPGQILTVVVDASDDVGVTNVALVCTPTFAGCESRAVNPAALSTRQTFLVDIPASFQSTTGITLLATASDQAGNAIQVGRSVVVPDTVAPTLTALETVSGSTQVVAGQTVALRATVADNVGVTGLAFTTEGALTSGGTAPVAPPVTSGTAPLSIVIPAGAANGSTITVRVRARDNGGNLSTERSIVLGVGDTAPPALTILAPAAGAQAAPGQTITFSVRATDDTAVQRIVFTASGVATATETRQITPPVASTEASFALPLPAATAAGTVTLTAEAFDAAGNSSGAASRVVTVTDTTAPSVQIVAPPAGTLVDPRQPLTITIQATDAVGVAQVSFAAGGSATASETRPVSPPVTSRTETFTITFASPLPTGGTLNLNASARDAAGNTGTATGLTLQVRDVVAPTVTSVTPINGATGIDRGTAVTIVFSEPMDRATLSTATVRLAAGATPVPVTIGVAADDRSVTLTPTSLLAVNTVFTVTVDAAVGDPGGNALGTAFVSTFRTSSPDTVAPQVESIDPANNATGVATTTPVSVTFSEAIDPATVTTTSFRVSTGGAPVSGTFAFLDGNRTARFTPSAPWPFEAVVVTEISGGITDAAGNALVNASGQPLTSPLTFTFLTGNFAITSPAGTSVIERTTVTLAAQASAALNPSSVVFSVNGTSLPAITAAPFNIGYTVPARVTAATLTIVASARNAQNAEIARAEKTVTVSGGLTASPSILGLPRAATRTIRLSIAETAQADIPIALTAVDPAVASPGAAQVTLPAGATHVDVPVTACSTCPWDPAAAGKAIGTTAIVATSSRGPAVTIVSVSDPVPGQNVSALTAPVGMAVSQPPTLGHVFSAPAQTSTTTIRVLSTPHAGQTPLDVTITSSNPSVATATAAPLQPGEQTVTLTITALQEGVTVLTIRVGTEVRTLTIVVGAATPGLAAVIASQPVGFAVSAAPSAGQIVSSVGRTSSITIQVLTTPHPGPGTLPVTVTSSNPAVATAVASAVEPGSQVTTLTITTVAEGFVTFTIRAGTSIRSVSVYVGTPPPSQTPVTFAQPVGVSVVGLPFIGKAFAPSAASTTIGVLLLPAAAATPTVVTVTSSNPAVASPVSPTATVAAGSRMLSLDLTTGAAGTATLTLEFGGVRREFQVVVGTGPTPANAPIIVAPPVGVSIAPLPGMGRINVASGSAVSATLGIQLFATTRGTSTPVTITSNNPSVVSIGGSASVTASVPAGTLTVPVPLLTSGTAGVAVLRFEFDGSIQELLVVVGTVSPSQTPALTAPVVGIRINP